MGTPIIETTNLSFGYDANITVLNRIGLRVESATIYGFVGPNGAGKTTFIRLLLGLLPNRTGQISIFGKSINHSRIDILSRLGCLVEQPSLYENLTGRENLVITSMIRGLKKSRIPVVLQLVDLTDAGGQYVSAYSLGMKQRLGLAIALLGEPELLILDEPANGLDPTGIIEMRELLIRLNKEYGTTIFLSSHLLSELEKLVTHIGILRKGEMVFQGSMTQLEALQHGQTVVVIDTNDNQACFLLLKNDYPTIILKANRLQFPYMSKSEIGIVCNRIVSAGFSLYEAKTVHHTLEDVFIKLTNNQ